MIVKPNDQLITILAASIINGDNSAILNNILTSDLQLTTSYVSSLGSMLDSQSNEVILI